jgi:hypothetical protein
MTLSEAIEAYHAGNLSGSELAGILHRDLVSPRVVELVLTLHTRAMQKRRVERRLARLWHYRWGEVLGALYHERTQCAGVLVGGMLGKSVSKYLGPLGKLKWLQDKRGTEQQWAQWSKELREYSMKRLAQLEKRIDRVEAMKPPVCP